MHSRLSMTFDFMAMTYESAFFGLNPLVLEDGQLCLGGSILQFSHFIPVPVKPSVQADYEAFLNEMMMEIA